MPFMKGLMPVRRTLTFLEKGEIYFRNNIRIICIGYHRDAQNQRPNNVGTIEFIFWHWAQLQYKNPDVQLVKYHNLTPNPFIQAIRDDGSQILLDIDNHSRQEIHDRVKKVLGKSELLLKIDRLEEFQLHNPANFGNEYARQCTCEMQGQQPCPNLLPVPQYMRGKWRLEKEE